MLPKLSKCFLAINGLTAFSLSQAPGNLLFDFLTRIVLTQVSRDEVMIHCLVEKLVGVGEAPGFDLFCDELFDLGALE
jgi:hypothetical protein